jgi:hypothetical protein
MPDPMMNIGPAGNAAGGASAPPDGTSGTGASPATMPVANEGIKATARAGVANLTSKLFLLAAAFGAGSEEAEHITKAIQALNKVASPRDMSVGLMNAEQQKAQMAQRQNQQNMLAMQRMQQQTPPMPQAA